MGVVTGGDEQLGGGVVADAVDLEDAERGLSEEWAEQLVESLVLFVEVLRSPAELAQHDQRRLADHIVALSGPQRRGGVQQGFRRQVLEAGADLIAGTETEMTDLVENLDSFIDRRTTGDPQHPDRLHIPITTLRQPRGRTRQGGPSRRDGVDMIGLALPVPHLPIRSIHLDHTDPAVTEMASQPGPIGAGAFNTTLSSSPKLSSHRLRST